MPHRIALGLAAGAALTLAGCGTAPNAGNGATRPVESIDNGAGKAADPSSLTPPPAPVPAPTATTTAAADDMAIDDSAQGAANLIRHYYADLNRGDFRAAYLRWGNEGQNSSQSFDDFKRGFAKTASTTVEVGTPGDGEGAAGSIYIDVPVTVRAQLKDGSKQTFTGQYSLRRVNDVPGSTQAQRRWHIYTADLKKE